MIPEGQNRGGEAKRAHTRAEWAAVWVQRFQVYHDRRFGPRAVVSTEHLEDFLRFIAER